MALQEPYNLFAQQKRAYYDSPQAHGVAEVPTTAKVVQNPATQPMPTERIAPVLPVSTPQPQPQPQKQQRPTGTIDRNSATSGMDYLSSMLTTPQQEEQLRKASVANQRIMAVADALRHIGNIYNTVNYAPAQQLNNPVVEEQQRYEKGKALRDAANLKYYTYQQQKAAQEAKQKQWEHDYALKVADAARKAGYTEAQIKNMQDKLAQQKAYNDANINLKTQQQKAQVERWERQDKENARHHRVSEGIAGMNAKTNRDRATAYIKKLSSGGNASSTPLATPNGSIYAPGKSIPQAQMNQMYKWATTNGYINQSEFQKKMAEAGFGKADPDYVRNQMVAEAMMEHGELADYARDNYGWTYGNNSGGDVPMIGWDDDEEENNGLTIGW